MLFTPLRSQYPSSSKSLKCTFQYKPQIKISILLGACRRKTFFPDRLLAEKFRVPFIDLKEQKVSRSILESLPKKFINQYRTLPIKLDSDILTVVTLRPDTSSLRDIIIEESNCNMFVLPLLSPPTSTQSSIILPKGYDQTSLYRCLETKQ